ncbi:CYTH domain-containing protein [Sphingobium lactosutens]|uniref:CYTH domain-containing protein n=1 Tax=Sphingobium lactosutens TaxID=522773 RepID=UPI0015B9D77C|nr:hypothetical protein [Sphingobium lactosutens]
MALEIERKFLVNDDRRRWLMPDTSVAKPISRMMTTRVYGIRIADDRAWLTIKRARAGIARDEFEYEISAEDGQKLLDRLSAGPPIEKAGYCVPHAGHVWDADVSLEMPPALYWPKSNFPRQTRSLNCSHGSARASPTIPAFAFLPFPSYRRSNPRLNITGFPFP